MAARLLPSAAYRILVNCFRRSRKSIVRAALALFLCQPIPVPYETQLKLELGRCSRVVCLLFDRRVPNPSPVSRPWTTAKTREQHGHLSLVRHGDLPGTPFGDFRVPPLPFSLVALTFVRRSTQRSNSSRDSRPKLSCSSRTP
jgi:hypothetical protein